MGKFDGILICTDLDGTLYKNDKTISKENLAAIEYFKREGGHFTFVTGRLPYYSLDAARTVSPNIPFGCINGGGVYDSVTDRYVYMKELDREALLLVDYIYREMPRVGVQLCGFYKTYFARESDATEYFRAATGVPECPCDYKSFDLPLAKIIFCTKKEEAMDKTESLLRSHPLAESFEFIHSERALFEVLPRGVDKGLSLTKLALHLGVDVKRTVAVGDYDNDAAMLRAAGLGVAVSNASPAALAAADVVTVSNEEHAIARIICDIESGELDLEAIATEDVGKLNNG